MRYERLIRLLRLPVAGFFLALLGFACNLFGWYVVESRAVAMLGLVTIAVGIGWGFIGILIGQISTLRDWKDGK